MQPREVQALVDGDRRRFSRLAELVAWGLWVVVVHMPFIQIPDQHRAFRMWLRVFTPPGFIKPVKK